MHGALPKAVAKIRRFLKKIAWEDCKGEKSIDR